jgi:hypothetical protein
VAETAPFNPERGYWVYYLGTGDTDQIVGIPADGLIRLTPGWNLVSPVADTPLPGDGSVSDVAWWWDTEAGVYQPVANGDVPGRAAGTGSTCRA